MRSFASGVRFVFCLSILSGSLALSGCEGDGYGSTAAQTLPSADDAAEGSTRPFDPSIGPGNPADDPGKAPDPTNHAPAISGVAPTAVAAGTAYSFTPKATDPDGDPITFTIANKPNWAKFDTTTGTLTGTPTSADAGTYGAIEIAATDGIAVTPLPTFTITVSAAASISTQSVSLSWTPPTQNDDGSALQDLRGYRIHYGKASRDYTEVIDLDNPGLTRYVLDSLPSGKIYIAMTAYNAAGMESDYSQEVSVTVN